MSRQKKNVFVMRLRGFAEAYLPNRRDNGKQILIKIFFILALLTLCISVGILTGYFLSARHQDAIVERSRDLWHRTHTVSDGSKTADDQELLRVMREENSDFRGWLTISGTNIDHPVFQARDNSFYLSHNQQKKTASCGALFFDARHIITEEKTDQNLVIYGHNMRNGSMFGTLSRLRSLSFYQQNPTITFSALSHTANYRIYAVFLLNAAKEDDGGYIYNIYRNRFIDQDDFDAWVSEAKERSFIHTGVDVMPTDRIITLVTCAYDFEDARLVAMARESREEDPEDYVAATVNPSPRYPKRWYEDRSLAFPFENK